MEKYEFTEFNGEDFLIDIGIPSNYIKVRRLFLERDEELKRWPSILEEFKMENGDIPNMRDVRNSVKGKYLKIMLSETDLLNPSKELRLTYIVKINKYDSIDSVDTLFCSGFVYYTNKRKYCLNSSFTISIRENNIDFMNVVKVYKLDKLEFSKIVLRYINSIIS